MKARWITISAVAVLMAAALLTTGIAGAADPAIVWDGRDAPEYLRLDIRRATSRVFNQTQTASGPGLFRVSTYQPFGRRALEGEDGLTFSVQYDNTAPGPELRFEVGREDGEYLWRAWGSGSDVPIAEGHAFRTSDTTIAFKYPRGLIRVDRFRWKAVYTRWSPTELSGVDSAPDVRWAVQSGSE